MSEKPLMTEKEMIESAGNDWLCNRNGQTSREEDALLTEGFASGAEWAFGEAGAIHAAEQEEWANEREALKRLVAEPVGLPVGTRTQEHSCERLLLAAASGDDAAKAAAYLWGVVARFEEGEAFARLSVRLEEMERAARVVEFLWNDMGEARRLAADAASIFRSYEQHHRRQAGFENADQARQMLIGAHRERRLREVEDRMAKADHNAQIAARLEKWLAGDPDNPAEVMRALNGGGTVTSIVNVDRGWFDKSAIPLKEPVLLEAQTWDGPCPVCKGQTFALVEDEATSGRFQRCYDCKTVVDLDIYEGGVNRLGDPACGLSAAEKWRMLFREEGRQARRDGKTLGDCPALPAIPERPDLFAGVSHIDEWIIGWREEDFDQSRGPGLEECRSRFETGNFRSFPDAKSREEAQRIANQDLEAIRSNVRPVVNHPLAEADTVEGIIGALDNRRSLTLASEGSFRLQTADPRFDPAQPVRVNGFLYHPATEDPCKTN